MLIVSRSTAGIQLRPEDLRRPVPSLFKCISKIQSGVLFWQELVLKVKVVFFKAAFGGRTRRRPSLFSFQRRTPLQ